MASLESLSKSYDPQSLLTQLRSLSDDSPVTNRTFIQAFSQLLLPLIDQHKQLARAVTVLQDDNAKLKKELESQRMEQLVLRNELKVISSMCYSPVRANISSNILIHAVPEKPNESLADLRNSAFTHLKSLTFDDNTVLRPSNILSVMRLGTLSKPNKQRPLVVKLNDQSMRPKLAKASYDLYHKDRKLMAGKPYVTIHRLPFGDKENWTNQTEKVRTSRQLNISRRS